MKPLVGVVVQCLKGCWHLVSAEEDYFEAWAKAFPAGGLDSATTVMVSPNAPAVRELRRRRK